MVAPSGYTYTSNGTTYGYQNPIFDYTQAAYAGSNTDSSSNSNTLTAPSRTTLDQAYQSVLNTGLLPTYNPINYTGLTGYDQSYWDNLYSSAKQRKEKEFFTDDNSLQNQLKTVMNQRGLVGSGIEAGSFEDLYADYGEQLGLLESDLSRQRAESDLDISKFNLQNQLDVDKYNRDYQNFLSELGMKAAGDEARTATEYDTKMFQTEVDLEKSKADQLAQVINALSNIASSSAIKPEVSGPLIDDILAAYYQMTS